MDTKIIIAVIKIMGLIMPNNSDEDTGDSGAASFENVLDNWSIFIDKTLFLKTLFDKETPAKILIRAPRDHGKSTNLDMIKRFLEIDTRNYDGNQSTHLDLWKTENYYLFSAGNKLNILKYQKLFDEHFGKYPVMFIDYKLLWNDGVSTDYDRVLTRIQTILSNVFVQHTYLLKSSKLWFKDQSDEMATKDHFSKFIDLPQKQNKLSETDIRNGFTLLAQLLFKEFGKPVFVLIDDFDTYVDNLDFSANKDADRIGALIQSITGELLKSNSVDHALLMGTHCQANNRHSHQHINSNTLKNLIEYKFLDTHAFNEYHGITEKEFNGLLDRIIGDANEIKLTKGLVHEHVPWHTMGKENIKLYSTFPVVNFLRHRTRTGYRLVSSDF